MKILTPLLAIFVLAFTTISLNAQDAITSTTAIKTDTRSPKTPIFIHKVNSPGATIASLEAQSRSGSADFTWDIFDETSKTYTTIHTNTAPGSTITNQGTGGYRVIRDNDGVNPKDTLYCWVITDYISIDAITTQSECGFLSFTIDHTLNILYYYYDLSVSPEQQFTIGSNPKITLKASADIYDGLGMEEYWNTTNVRSSTATYIEIRNPAPLANASYTATITNDFGNTSADFSTPEIPAKAVYAVMKAEAYSDKDKKWEATTDLKGSALYKLRFDHSDSKNADTYTWLAYDNDAYVQTRNTKLWTLTTNDSSEKAYSKYTYLGEELDGYLPGKYRDSLFVLNSVTGCKDSVDVHSILGTDSTEPFITVEPSKFDPQSMPNVFTPNGDGVNDIFKFVTGSEPVSMKTINFRVFDRVGKELYYYNGRVSDWQGWNGKVKGTGSDCPVGVYYYEISGSGWDDKSYSGKPYRGFFHIFKE